MTTRNLIIKHKDSKAYRIKTPITDLTDYSVLMMVRGINPKNFQLEITGEIDELDKSVSIIKLTSVLSASISVGNYKYAIKLIDPSDDITTIISGNIIVEDEV